MGLAVNHQHKVLRNGEKADVEAAQAAETGGYTVRLLVNMVVAVAGAAQAVASLVRIPFHGDLIGLEPCGKGQRDFKFVKMLIVGRTNVDPSVDDLFVGHLL